MPGGAANAGTDGQGGNAADGNGSHAPGTGITVDGKAVPDGTVTAQPDVATPAAQQTGDSSGAKPAAKEGLLKSLFANKPPGPRRPAAEAISVSTPAPGKVKLAFKAFRTRTKSLGSCATGVGPVHSCLRTCTCIADWR